MDRIEAMHTFCRVAETGSFSAAARGLKMSPPRVSRLVSALEQHLGVRLLNRTTRHVELSDAGRDYYPACVEWLAGLDALESAASKDAQRPSGLLRLSVPMDFGRLFMGPVIREYLSRAPEVQLEVMYEDRVIRLVEEQVDVAIRIGTLDDSALVARRLGQACIACFASPDYLALHGMPDTPADLDHHRLLEYSLSRTPGRWRFPNGDIGVAERWQLSGNNGRALAEAACRGAGIVRLPEFLIQDHLREGRLVEVLRAYRSPPLDISAVTPERRFRPARTRLFLDILVCWFSEQPDWTPTSS